MADDQKNAEAALLALALNPDAKGQVQALRFYLCNRFPDRWKSETSRAAEPAAPYAKKIIRIYDGTEEPDPTPAELERTECNG